MKNPQVDSFQTVTHNKLLHSRLQSVTKSRQGGGLIFKLYFLWGTNIYTVAALFHTWFKGTLCKMSKISNPLGTAEWMRTPPFSKCYYLWIFTLVPQFQNQTVWSSSIWIKLFCHLKEVQRFHWQEVEWECVRRSCSRPLHWISNSCSLVSEPCRLVCVWERVSVCLLKTKGCAGNF